MQDGTVLAHNPETQQIVVLVDGNRCAVFELTSDFKVLVGHRVRGSLENPLCFALYNSSTRQMIGVIPQGIHLSSDEALREIGC
jgi:hypothetical protein